ncbi:AI-2E family transporter [Thermococcus peptonophilus]|uniref:AI-2E family transporter n=1 Tax=Thermococcus peptonophilus TaxID=53952 RepID=A0A142CVX8_9EURY|nr:AI-2E family transporter [Thermococcus peptonophilus]AMQ18930.1 AI-2E family transporter [Thermococcus peptonophilus]
MKVETAVWAAVIAVILYVSWRVIHPFLEPLFFGLILAYAFYPIHRRLRKFVGNRESAVLISFTFLVLGGTLTFELAMMSLRLAVSFAGSIGDVLNWILTLPLPEDAREFIFNIKAEATTRIADYVSSRAFSIPLYIIQLIVFFLAFYYGLAYSEQIARTIRELLPEEKRELGEEILTSVHKTLSALVRAWLLLNVAKGILMTLGYIVFGVSDIYTAVIAGFLTFAFSFVPLFEGWMIWLAAAIHFALNGMYLHAIGISVYGALLVSPMPDYTIRPMLVARDTELDETLVFIGMVGGTWAMGLKGIIIGPIVLNLLLVLVKEWKKLTESSHRPSSSLQEPSSRPRG